MQVRGRTARKPLFQLLQPEPAAGFALLPKPALGDVFFDIEGDPVFEPDRGLEYLFGFWLPGESLEYRAFWAHDREEEKRTFEATIDFLIARRKQFPEMHVYHYADYEKSALRRLAQLHGTREEEVDELLRGEVFVDLYAVVRQALVISEDSYGLKAVELLYDFKRDTQTMKGDQSIVMFERWLLERTPSILTDIENYNRDDCLSTFLLRDWLLARRTEAIEQFGAEIEFRCDGHNHPEPLEKCKKCQELEKELRERKHATDLQTALLAREDETSKRLAHLLAYHRREDKPVWWAYFDRCNSVDELFEFDKEAIARLEFCDDVEPYPLKNSLVFTYTFPEQQHKMGPGDAHDPRTRKSGEIIRLDEENGRLELKRTGSIEEARAVRELIPPGPIPSRAQRDALVRIADSFVAGTLATEYPATLDLLTNADPRLTGGVPGSDLQPKEVNAQSILDVVRALDRSYLFIQGPPGSGKTTHGSQVICELLAERQTRCGDEHRPQSQSQHASQGRRVHGQARQALYGAVQTQQ